MENGTHIITKQKKFFQTGATRSLPFRMGKLQTLYAAIKRHEQEIYDALKKDLNKSAFEAYETEIGIVLAEIRDTLRHLPEWIKPKRVATPVIHFPSSSRIYTEPYGTVLIMSPWNYPFQLTMVPLIGAIAAGNCCVVKPSAYSANTSAVIETIIREVFEEAYVAVVQGGREANQELLQEKYDYIFFTGSPSVGRTVMAAAAKHLTPVTLELGGKSPCIVDETANISLAAKRIVWGKFLNAGQTCVAPDYLLVHSAVRKRLLAELKRYITRLYGKEPLKSPDYPKIINEKHFERLLGLISGTETAFGGEVNRDTLQLAPTLLTGVTWDSAVMQEEIFGPLLPILEFDSLAEVISLLAERPKPLACYFFTTSKRNADMLLKQVSFGGGCINDTIIHLSNSLLPFGGVGESGMGQYHGKYSYDTFTHKKGVIRKSNRLDIDLRYPPYKNHLALLKKLF